MSPAVVRWALVSAWHRAKNWELGTVAAPLPGQHPAAWTGGENLLVATALGDRDAPVAYDLRERRQVLNPDRPPATPVRVKVPVETDFNPKPQATIGDWIGTIIHIAYPAGLYLTKARFVGNLRVG